ncbi:MAG: DUF5117 domain-containing protein, partial [Gammaproteobacteria bacterium]|nr:DUF5117 domain-containing protein [Gammaproteobacteria bacterium]
MWQSYPWFRHLLALFVVALLSACGTNDAAKGDDNTASIEDIAAASERFDGFFTLYQDKKSGKVHLLIRKDQLDHEFIHHHVTVNGAVQGGHFVGQYGDSRVLILQRHFDRIEFVQQNTHFYFDPTSPLSRAADANIPASILAVEDIVAEDSQTGDILIALDGVLLKEKLLQVKATPDPEAPAKETFVLGKLSETRNKIVRLRNYPQNTAVIAEYVYENAAPVVPGEEDVTDTRSMSVQVEHNFIAIPDNGYQPRRDDYRVGYFTDRITDLTDPSHTPFRDVIQRWHLVKKDPQATLSEPVEPITWWIENTTPHEFRDIVRRATLAWNIAFETAGFKNAIAVEVQPDDAQWDAGDLRYNVLRWTSSPQPPFGGYGPSFTNPRTGQILGADVMLEYIYMRNHRRVQDLLQPEVASPTFAFAADPRFCSLGYQISEDMLFASEALQLFDEDSQLQKQLIRDSLFNLVLHEVGHAIGLSHNMRASQLIADTFDPELVEKFGLTGSVMEYPDVNFAPPGKTQTLYYQVEPGSYDKWAIEFGYSSSAESSSQEAARIEAILQRSTEPGLAFGNDADDMRNPENGIDPHIQINDLSSDAIGHAIASFQNLEMLVPKMTAAYAKDRNSWQALVNGYGRFVRRHGAASQVIASYIGGVHINRVPPGVTSINPYTPVALVEQKRAMRALAKYVFAPNAVL